MSKIIQFEKQKTSEVGLTKELLEVQISTINKVLKLADKYNLDRDNVFRMFLNVLKRAHLNYSFKYYDVEDEIDD